MNDNDKSADFEQRLTAIENQQAKIRPIVKRNTSNNRAIAIWMSFFSTLLVLGVEGKYSKADGWVLGTRELKIEVVVLAMVPGYLMADEEARNAIGKLIGQVLRK